MNQLELIVKMSLDAWYNHISRTDKLFTEFSDVQLQREIAPGKNTGTYLLGHLAAVHDGMLPLLGLGNKMFPDLENIFIKHPDKSGLQKPPIKDLRMAWGMVNDKLAAEFSQLKREAWLEKHTAVSDEDFLNEPHRNRLNVLLSRTNHLASHYGQLLYLKE